MKLRGGNLEEVEVEYKLLSEYHFLVMKDDKTLLKNLKSYI